MQKKAFVPLLRIGIALFVLIPFLSFAPAQVTPSHPSELEATTSTLARVALTGATDLQLIIELNEPSVVEAMLAEQALSSATFRSTGVSRPALDLSTTQAGGHRLRVQSSHRTLLQRLSSFGDVQVQGSIDTVLNAVFVRVPFARYSEIQRLPGVKKVYFSHRYRIALDYAAGVQNAQGMWDKAGGSAMAGAGVRIGVIDTGIDIANPMFVDDSLTPPSDFPRGDTNFTNKKVIVARNYVDTKYGYAQQAVTSAIDEVGHGTFVAGCAAGKQVAAPVATIAGMAPGAFLGSYKVFGTPGINDSAHSAAILVAINDAVNDGMNVLNLSLGALNYIAASEDAESIALSNAIAGGVVAVLAAGNDGPDNYTISNPGSTPDAITVGAVTNARTFIYQLRATGPGAIPSNLQNIPYVDGSGLTVAPRIPSTAITDVSTIESSGLACTTQGVSPLPSGSLTGKIAFIARGTCTFADKITNATNAGAIAAIVYNNVSGAAASIMGGVGTATIPAVMISNPDGLALKDFLSASPALATVEIDAPTPVSTTPGILASFSSRGPSPEFNLKPDLVAVGAYVYSAAQKNNANGVLYNSTRFMVSQGTSFSTPMVAGAAAVMKQLFPNFTSQDIKSALTTTASRTVTLDGTTSPNLIQAGAGLLDMAKATSVGATFAPSSLSFGANEYSSSITLTKSFLIKNVSSTNDQFIIAVEPLVAGPTISLSKTNTGSIPPGGSTSVNLTIQASAPLTGGFQGFVTIQSAATASTYRVPYWSGIFVPNSSVVLSVSQSSGGTGTAYSTLAGALAKARPGNVIEIADSGTYPAGLTVATNEEGLPLHGITIRATAGNTPTLNGVGTGVSADLNIIGLRNVLLQGLTITGGQIGVLLTQIAASDPASTTIDHCTITNITDPSLGLGVLVSNGGALSITQSTVSNCSNSGIVALDGTQLTLSKTTVDSNQYFDGIEAYNSNVQILNSTITNNYGQGIYLSACSGTIDGSIISGNLDTLDSYGDGIEIIDGRVTVTNNTFESNAGRGIGLFTDSGTGPAATVSRNIVRSNGMHGILLNPAQNARLEGNFIKANGVGIRILGGTSAVLLNNIIAQSASSSTVSDPGTAIYTSGTSNVRIINNTLFANSTGVFLEAGSTSPVWNSILNSNTRDVTGLQASDIQYSLVGDSSLATGSNITGDPSFADSRTDNFEPGSGSPAWDAGSNTVADLPFLDYNQRLRIASTGSRAGEGKVDMGAIEAGSTYPLVFPLLANGQQAAFGDDFITGFAVLNNNTFPIIAGFSAYDPTGVLIAGTSNPAAQTIGAGAQVPILGHQLFGYDYTSSQLGAVLAGSRDRLTGFFLIFDRGFSRFADGVDVSDGAGTTLSFIRHLNDASGHTSYCLFNPGVNPANVSATLYTTAGSTVGTTKTGLIAPKGQFVFSFDDVTLSSGSVRVESDRPVAGIELFGNTTELSALRAAPPATEARLYFPHFAVNGGFSTGIGIVNTAGNASALTLIAYYSDGSRLGLPVTRTLGSNAQLFESVASLFGLGAGTLTTGYIEVQSDTGGLAGYTGFRYDDGRVQSAAAVPAIAIPRQKLLFSHIAHQVPAGSSTYQTGIALLNPFGVRVSYTMRVFDGTGAKRAEMTSTIGPGEKISRYLSHPAAGVGFFTQALPLSSGHVEVTSDLGLIGFELFYTEDISQLASVPAQTGN